MVTTVTMDMLRCQDTYVRDYTKGTAERKLDTVL